MLFSKLLIKSQKAVKRSELTHEEERLLKDDLNVSYCFAVVTFHLKLLPKEWQVKMAEKVDHMPSSNDDELPPVRSGHISMAKPVRKLIKNFIMHLFKILESSSCKALVVFVFKNLCCVSQNIRRHLASQMVPRQPVSNRVTTKRGTNMMSTKNLLPWKLLPRPHLSRARMFHCSLRKVDLHNIIVIHNVLLMYWDTWPHYQHYPGNTIMIKWY